MVRTAVKEETNSKKLAALDDALKALNSKHKSSTGNLIFKLGSKPMEVETISSGSVVLNSSLGGGFAKGRIIELYGLESSGKTSFALTAAANVQKEGGTVAFIDLENALDPKYARKLGVDTDALLLSQPDYAEQALQLVVDLTQTNLIDLIIVDSVAALVPKAELEGDMEQQSMGVIARMMSKALRKLVGEANKSGTTVIFINQIREKIGVMFGDPTTTTGGKALKFYASQRIRITRGEQVKDDSTKEIIGNKIKFKVVKNKIAPPFAEGETVLTFNKGINRQAELLEVGVKFGIITLEGRTYTETASGEKINTNKNATIATLTENTEMFDRLSKALAAKISEDIFDDSNDDEKLSENEEIVSESKEVEEEVVFDE